MDPFEKNQKDLMLDDLKVWWVGDSVVLLKGGQTMTIFSARSTTGPTVAEKISRWCVKNHYRCSQVQNGKVML